MDSLARRFSEDGRLTPVREGQGLLAFYNDRYFPALDGVRALSVLLVMSNHLHSSHAVMRQMPGWCGVDIFCVLSGFLITTLLLREWRDFGSVKLSPFYIRRFFRIAPVFLLVLAIYAPISYFGEHGARWAAYKSALPLYLAFMQDFVPHEAPFSASWTLGIEEKFYFVWPILGFLLVTRLRARALLSGLAFLLCAGLYVAFEATSDRAFYHARSYAALALGSLLACFLASRFAETYTAKLEKIPSFVPSLLVGATLLAVFYHRRYVLLLDLSIALLLSHLVLVPGWVRAGLASPWLVWIGRRSYSMYLIHLLVLNPIRVLLRPKSVPGELGILLVAYFVTAALAHIIFLFVEEPSRRFSKRVIAKRLSRPGQPMAMLDTPS